MSDLPISKELLFIGKEEVCVQMLWNFLVRGPVLLCALGGLSVLSLHQPRPERMSKEVQQDKLFTACYVSPFFATVFFLKNIPSLSISACCPALSTLFPCSQSGKWEIRKQLPSYFTSEVLPYFHKLSFVFAGVWKTRPDHPPPPNPRRAESTVGLIILHCSSTCCFYWQVLQVCNCKWKNIVSVSLAEMKRKPSSSS